MLKRLSIFGLMITLFSTCVMTSATHAQSTLSTEGVAKVRARVTKIGTGQAARVVVTLRERSSVRGYISAVEPVSFTVVERDTGSARTISYEDVVEIKRPSSGLSTKSWLIIGAAAVGAVVTWSIVKPAVCDGGAQTRGLC